MPGRVASNLRSGFLHEELGILLMRQFAAVAPLPRADDYGIDAVCTLLGPPRKTVQPAAGSFYVQFKTDSVDSITYSERGPEGDDLGEIKWLQQLQLPLFFARTSLVTSTIELFSTQWMYARLVGSTVPQEITVSFEDRPADELMNPLVVKLGPPILRWSFASHADHPEREAITSLLERVLRVEQANCVARPLGCQQRMTWQTNSVQEDVSLNMSQNPFDLCAIGTVLRAMRVPVFALAVELHAKGTDEDVAQIIGFRELMRRYGVDPGADAEFKGLGALKVFRAANDQQRTKGTQQSK